MAEMPFFEDWPKIMSWPTAGLTNRTWVRHSRSIHKPENYRATNLSPRLGVNLDDLILLYGERYCQG